MAWRDELARVTLPDGRRVVGASFRGVPFYVEASERGGGRRAVVHEFPGRDEPAVDDQGRKARPFRFEAYVIGADYMADRDALLEALDESEGPGELVHPYQGRHSVICANLTVRETVTDGGMAVFQLEFVEAPGALIWGESPDLASLVDAAADAALAANLSDLESAFDVAGQPSFALASLRAELTGLSAGLGASLSGVVEGTQELARLSVQLDLLSSQAASLVREPADMVSGLLAAVDLAVAAALNAPKKVIGALLQTYALPAGDLVLGDTATRAKERANQAAQGAALRTALVVEAARLLTAVPWESIEEATATRESVVAAIDALAADSASDTYSALTELRSSVQRAIPGATELARLLTLDQRVELPSLVLSYRLYGTVDQEADIIARNSVAHPGFVAGVLEVLSSV